MFEKKSRFHWLNRWLDKSTFFSFDKRGFLRHAQDFEKEDWTTQKKQILITGGNSGIGLACAKAFSREGHELHLICRNKMRGEQALEEIEGVAYLYTLDISDLKKVQQFTKRLPFSAIDCLILNAGGLSQKKRLTIQGHESTFATHVFGHFALTQALITQGILKAGARVIWVSSGGMYLQHLVLNDLNFIHTPYRGYTAYANAKRAQVILNEQLAVKYQEKNICFSCMHPGWVKTPGVKKAMPWFYRFMKRWLRAPYQGANTIVWLALTQKKYKSGLFWFDRKPVSTHYLKRTVEKKEEKEALFNLCEKIINET